MKFGETFEKAAIRGLKEELGIRNPRLKKLLKFRMNYGPNDNTTATLYECECKTEIKIERKEVKEAKFLPLNKIKGMLIKNERKFAPWTREILKWYFGLPSKVEEIK